MEQMTLDRTKTPASWALQAAARAWCSEKNSMKEMDSDLAAEFARILEDHTPALGMATTAELLDEIRARIEVDGKLGYKTFGTE